VIDVRHDGDVSDVGALRHLPRVPVTPAGAISGGLERAASWLAIV
jgi:hypothetical protein